MKRRKVEGRNRLEENAKRKIWTTNNELKQRKLAIKVLYKCNKGTFLSFFLTIILSAEKSDEKSP